jgi:transposase-like protein
MHRAELITVERRRRWSWADKRQIVDETLVPGASLSAVARRYGLHPSQVFAWRKTVRNVMLAGQPRVGNIKITVPRAGRRQRDRTIEQPRHLQRNRKFVDSPLERDGFKPSVPRCACTADAA